MTTAIVVIAVAIVLLIIRNARKAKRDGRGLQMAIPPGWWYFTADGLSGRPEVLADGSIRIDVPPLPGYRGHVLDGSPRSLVGKTAMVTHGTLTGGPLQAREGGEVLLTHFIQRKGASLDDPNGRWYSQRALTLAEGEFELSTPLVVNDWINVMGQKDAKAFAATLANIGSIGYGFGAEIGRAHGVYAVEPAAIEVTLEAVG